MIAGVDEAGRGCVIGPLVICAFAMNELEEGDLKGWGVKDSKELTGEKREGIGKKLKRKGKSAVVEISAGEITESMRKKVSLNELEAIKVAEALKQLQKHGIDRVFVDSPDPNPKKFGERIRKHLGGELSKSEIISENKADKNHLVVGAASIMAKNRREKRVAEIKREVEEDFGSGYSSDERTIAYLEKNLHDAKLQKHLRHKWKTIERLKTTRIKLAEYF